MQPEINQPESVIAPLQKVTPISKYLAMALFVILPFIGGWIGYTFAPEKVVEVETVAVVEEGMNSGNTITSNIETFDDLELETYHDEVLGISFEYPSKWGKLTVLDERGKCSEDYLVDSCNQRLLIFEELNTNGEIFLATETLGHKNNPIGRGGFWGDKAGLITSDYLNLCKMQDECQKLITDNSVVFAKYTHHIFDWNDTEEGAKTIDDEYHLYRSDHEYYGYVLSPIRIKSAGSEIESEFEKTIIKTFRFIN